MNQMNKTPCQFYCGENVKEDSHTDLCKEAYENHRLMLEKSLPLYSHIEALKNYFQACQDFGYFPEGFIFQSKNKEVLMKLGMQYVLECKVDDKIVEKISIEGSDFGTVFKHINKFLS